MARGSETAFNLIDGRAWGWDFGGTHARLETDGIAWRLGGQIRVIEIKSFPIVDGQADPEKVGAAVYVATLADLLAGEGFDPEFVSTTVLLVARRTRA